MMETTKGASDADDREAENEKQHENEKLNEDEDEELESRRLHIFRATVGCVIKKIVNCMSIQNFIDIATGATVNKTVSRHEEKYLNRFYTKFQRVLENAMKSDIDEYIENSGLLEAHEKISRTIPENVPTSSSVAAWRPTGDPRQDMKSHEAENKTEYNKRLQELVEEQEVKIQYLKQLIVHKRLLTHQLLKSLLSLQEDCMKISTCDSAIRTLSMEMLTFLSREVK